MKDRLSYTATYDTPFGNKLNGVGTLLLKNWSLSSGGFWQPGLAFSVQDSDKPGGPFGTITQGLRANVAPGVKRHERFRGDE